MRDDFEDVGLRRRETTETRPNTVDVLDLLGRRLGGAIVLAGALIGLGLYASSGGGHDGPKYQAFATDGEVFRLNTESGTIIACNATRCTRILERGQELSTERGSNLFRSAPAAPQLPAPAAVQPATPTQNPATPAQNPAAATQTPEQPR